MDRAVLLTLRALIERQLSAGAGPAQYIFCVMIVVKCCWLGFL